MGSLKLNQISCLSAILGNKDISKKELVCGLMENQNEENPNVILSHTIVYWPLKNREFPSGVNQGIEFSII